VIRFGVLSTSVVAGCKDGENFHDVFHELVSRVGLGFFHSVQYGSKLTEQPLEELESETGESVRMGDHNCFDISFEELFQNGKKSWALVVDSTSNVFDESILRVFMLEEGGLAGEIASLFS
jgi:hypothetical protein